MLLGQAKKEDAASYASGLLIGTDVRIGLATPTGAEIHVIGRPELTHLYAAAIGQAGRTAIELDGETMLPRRASGNREEDPMSARELLQPLSR